LRVDRDEVARDVFDALLGAALGALPLPAAELRELRLVAFLAGVLVELVERAHVHEQLVAALEPDFDGLLLLLADGDRVEPGELPDAVIDVHDVVAGGEPFEVAQGEAALDAPPPRRRPAVAVEDLVAGVDGERLLLPRGAVGRW